MEDKELVEKVARAICCRNGCMNRGCPYCLADEETAARVIRFVLDRAAEVAESHAPATQDMRSTDIADACDRIATAIRALGGKPSP